MVSSLEEPASADPVFSLPLADCHLHFEGLLPLALVEALARAAGHPFGQRSAFEARRAGVRDASGFLSLYAEVCGLFRGPEDYARAAREISAELSRGRVRYAEIYVSPEIFARFGHDPSACLDAIEEGFRADEEATVCRILLDAVRQWGPESAERVLDLYERRPLSSIVGFGVGGDEASVPASSFSNVYLRARRAGLKTSIHAGEWGGPASLRAALDHLRPDRVDHGIAAAADPGLLERLADEGTPLCVAPTSNVATGAVAGWSDHPLRALLDAGVCVGLSADDPLFFDTDSRREYAIVQDRLGLSPPLLARLAENAWRGAFCSPQEKARALTEISAAAPTDL
jgi:adenosine deaminase